jgi:ABC-2 type transport system permease protein
LKETLVAPVSRLAIVLGRALGGATVAFLQGLIVLAICVLAGFRIADPRFLPLALLFMFLIALLFSAIGTALGSVLEDTQSFPLVMNFIVLPIFFFSNALFPIKGLPRPLSLVVSLNPLSYGVDGLRATLNRGALAGVATDLAVLGALTAALLSLGSYLFSRIEL